MSNRKNNTFSRPYEQNGNHRHGGTYLHPIEYKTWKRIKTRCYSVNNPDYPAWGGRGIYVCDEWKDDFSQFYSDMGDRPAGDYKIERIDNDGPYAPWNCKWATQIEQSNNGRHNHKITFNGITMNLSEWADSIGISRTLLQARLSRLGWSIEEALTIPVSASNKPIRIMRQVKVKAV